MPREGYIKYLRGFVGTEPLFMPSVTVFVRDGDKIVVGRLGGTLPAATGELAELGWATEAELGQLDTPAWLAPMLDNPQFEHGDWSPESA